MGASTISINHAVAEPGRRFLGTVNSATTMMSHERAANQLSGIMP